MTALRLRRIGRGVEEVCDLPEAGGYRRMLVVGHLPQQVCYLAPDAGDERGDLRDAEARGQDVTARREPQGPDSHGA